MCARLTCGAGGVHKLCSSPLSVTAVSLFSSLRDPDDYDRRSDYGRRDGYGRPDVPDKPDDCPSCPGKILSVWCWEDANGRLTDIAYLNSATANYAGTYLGCSGAIPTSSAKSLFLTADESIIRVETCGGR